MASNRDSWTLPLDELMLELDAGLRDLWDIVEGSLTPDREAEFVAILSWILALEAEIAWKAGIPPAASTCGIPCPISLNDRVEKTAPPGWAIAVFLKHHRLFARFRITRLRSDVTPRARFVQGYSSPVTRPSRNAPA
ncbi:MAG: hypothetical protein KAY32_15660 [Candidatus Eisenbacteria sp.]|nr:hypothetical protein [Candidatus Eisenbacteria bacterium]